MSVPEGGALLTPRISLVDPKVAVYTAAWTSDSLFTVQVGRGSTRGGVQAGWVPGVGIPGTAPSRLHWYCQGPTSSPRPRFCAHSGTPGPCRPLRTPLLPALSIPASGPIRARSKVIYPKVSINLGVSPKKAHEACHSPCFKNRLISHDLEFPGFPNRPAFSHKE